MSFPRASSPVKAHYDDISSPDPIAGSLQDLNCAQTSPRRRSSRGPNSSEKRTIRQQTRLSIDPELSPTKTVTEQTLSPWRIRVTVEAEPEAGHEAENITGQARTITKTVKVPLREESSPSGPNTRRKSNSSNTSANKVRRRSGTPDRAGRARRPSLNDLDAVVLGDDQDEDEWKASRPSPRKRRNSRTRTTPKPTAQSRRKSQIADFEIREDEHEVATVENTENNHVEQTTSPELRKIDLNRVSMRQRTLSMKEQDKDGLRESAQANPDTFKMQTSNRKVSTNSAMSYPTPSPSASEHGNSDDILAEKYQESEENHDGGDCFDTMIESEGFTMIDLDSIPSIKQLRSSPEQPQNSEREKNLQPAVPENSNFHSPTDDSVVYPSLAEPNHTELSSDVPSSPPDMSSQFDLREKPYSIAHLQIPSSTHVYRHRQVTPLTYSSPKLPSPPRPVPVRDRPTPDSNKAVKAGQVLQGAITPREREVSDKKAAADEYNRLDHNLFEGYDSSTRRELRAGLRFGEELAKKQKDSPPSIFQDVQNLDVRFDSDIQVWRSQSQEQNTGALDKTSSNHQSERQTKRGVHTQPSALRDTNELAAEGQARWERRWQREREDVIEQANKSDSIVIEDGDDASNEDQLDDSDNGNETDGDIWLAEAKKASSPREEARETIKPQFTDSERKQRERAREALEKPKRKLIPSPWKRGEYIAPEQANTMSLLSADTSMSGVFWKETSTENDFRFGAGVLAKPNVLDEQPQSFDRRRSGELDNNYMPQQPRRISSRHEPDTDEIGEEADLDADDDVTWRNAEDVVEEETNQLESEQDDVLARLKHMEDNNHHTKLHETNLEDVPEQDLSSSPHQITEQETIEVNHHDQISFSQSAESTIDEYRQRVSLSPSKQRPGTPRSALKGARLSYGIQPEPNDSEEDGSDRRVVWAKRSSCMNEHWEESSRSIRSATESVYDETPVPVERHEQPQHDSMSEAVSKKTQSSGSWFGWLRSSGVPPLDGSSDKASLNEESDFAPTSRHSLRDSQPTPTIASSGSSSTQKDCPSYLLPPSYPSDPTRNAGVPLSTSGEFTNTHFRTLHIIYRKSQKSRFHGPRYPDEIRPEICNLVRRKWSMDVDEGSSALGEIFTFRVRETEARVLERFMREVEHGYEYLENSGGAVKWGWSVEQLASWMGRIAVGEVVRAEEVKMVSHH